MPSDGYLNFDTKINTSGFSSGLSTIGSLASSGISSITGIFKAGADAVLGFGQQVMSTGAEYEAAIKQIAATLNYSVADLKDETSEAFAMMQKFSDKAREQGANTAFTAAQAAEGLNILAMQGWGELAIAISDSTLDLASAGKISIADSASYIGAAMKGFTEETGKFGDEAATAAHYADLIAKGATLAATSVGQLGDAFSSLSSTANSFHQDSTELEVLLLRLAEQNVVGSEADTAVRSLLTHLYTPLSSAQKIFDNIGFSAYHGSESRPVNEVLDDLNQKLTAYAAGNQEIYNQMAFSIFGQRGLPAYTKAIASDSEKVQYFFDELASADGSAKLQRETQESSFSGQLEILNSALSDLKIQIYEAIDEPFKESAEKAAGYLNILTESMKEGGFPAVLETIRENALPWADEIITAFADAFGLSDAWNAFKEDPAGVIAQTAVDLLLKGGEVLTENLGLILPAAETLTDALFDQLETDENKKRLTKIGGDLFGLLVDGALNATVDIFAVAARLSDLGVEVAKLTDWETISTTALKGLFHGIGNSLITMLDGSDWAVGFEEIAGKIFGTDFSFREWAEYLRDEYAPDDMWGVYEETLTQAAVQDYQKHYAWANPIGSVSADFFSEPDTVSSGGHSGGGHTRETISVELNQKQTLELDGSQIAEFSRKTLLDDNAVSGGW